MNRLERIAKSNELAGVRIIVTGCGYKPVQNVFHAIILVYGIYRNSNIKIIAFIQSIFSSK